MIHQLFEAQAASTPGATAIVFEERRLTYHELNARANQLAHCLQALGVGPDVLVGLCVERSPEMILGLLGILKAGGAYVPLDPSYPAERLSYMMRDAGVPVLLTQEKLASTLPAQTARVLCLDAESPAMAEASRKNPASAATANHLAYVIYTSGSTGRPKGVLIEHRGVCNLVKAQRELFSVRPDSRILQFASLGFDASVSEIFMALAAGARLVLGTQTSLLPGENLLRTLREHRITHVTLTPSTLAALPQDELPGLTDLIVAGEACPLDLIRRWSAMRRLFNAYGPTECSVCATVAPVPDHPEKLHIGRAIANTEAYILDRYLRPARAGDPGELYIGGLGLARGYLNSPA